MEVRKVIKADLDDIVEINNRFCNFLGGKEVDKEFFENYMQIDLFDVCLDSEILLGFLMVFGSHANYSNEHFDWFKKRFKRFLYIDRLVTRAENQRRGVAERLYQNLFKYGKGKYPMMVGEINVENTPSLRFNEKMGFKVIDSFFDSNGNENVAVLYDLKESKIY